ncbi:hypothetical protein ADUPG1_005796, partial [Aduncisulcus paluster]
KCFKCKRFGHYKRDCPGTTHSFKALQVSDHDRPVLPVKLLDSQGNDVQSTKTLLDSGASISFASKTFIETLEKEIFVQQRVVKRDIALGDGSTICSAKEVCLKLKFQIPGHIPTVVVETFAV